MVKNTVQAEEWFDECYLDSVPSRQMVEKWFADFKRDRTNTDVAKRSGLPNCRICSRKHKKIYKKTSVDYLFSRLYDNYRFKSI